ncbi:MAG: CBS domain-containing protein [Deltaproteobacteria bacterium]|nr:CBS domain-containing protein [Deltaproteobacteria bacterium]
MTEDPMVIDVSASIADAVEVLATLEIRHLPVMRGRALAGMLSDRDVKNGDPGQHDERRVATVMNTNVISVDPDASLAEIAETLVDNRIGAVAVVDPHEDELVGIVSYVDVLREVIRTE